MTKPSRRARARRFLADFSPSYEVMRAARRVRTAFEDAHFRHNLAFATLAAVPLLAIAAAGANLTRTLLSDGLHPAIKAERPLNWQKSEPAGESDLGNDIANAPVTHIPFSLAFGQATMIETGTGTEAWPRLAEAKRTIDPISAYLDLGPRSIAYEVESKDTLIGILEKHDIAAEEANAIVAAIKEARLERAARVRPKQEIALELGNANEETMLRPLMSASIKLDAVKRLKIERNESGSFNAETVDVPLTEHFAHASGKIYGSLSQSAEEQDVGATIIAQFADIYAYHVDFQRDIQANDEFEIFYSEFQNDEGERASGLGEIYFARLSFGAKTRAFYRFESADGHADYYDAEGVSARTFLMRTPVEGARISSSYGMRKHPILGFTKKHNGVDFAAPIGAIVYASGDGIIEFAGRKGTFGNLIRIRHENGYKTLYAHLNAFAKGVRAGVRVRQGQVIAQVGNTGRSSGPHLHYEIHIDNVPVNPMGVKVATGRKLQGRELALFKEEIARIDTAMDIARQRSFASAAPAVVMPPVIRASFAP